MSLPTTVELLLTACVRSPVAEMIVFHMGHFFLLGDLSFFFVHSFKDILILILSDIASLRKRNREDIVVTWSRRHCDADENNIDW